MRAPSRRGRWAAGLLALVLVFPVLLGAILAPFARAPGVSPHPEAGAPELRGAYHVHSRRSDGRGTDEEIAHAAAQAGLDFVVLTDHNLIEIPAPRFVEGVLLIYAVELSTPHGHVVALGLERGLTPEERAGPVLETVRARGGKSFLAHPVQRHWPWTDWVGARDASGLELVSWDSLFREALRRPFTRLLPALGAFAVRPSHALAGLLEENDEARRRLLELSDSPGRAPLRALCAHDAHGFPPYASLFRMMSLHLPGPRTSGDASAAAARVLDGLEAGGAHCEMDGLGQGRGFALEGLGPQRSVGVGKALEVRLPRGVDAELQVRVTGPAHVEGNGRTVRLDAEGPVLVEVWRRTQDLFLREVWKPWIVPSPVQVVRDVTPGIH